MEVDINEPFLNYQGDENDDNISKEIAKKIRGDSLRKYMEFYYINYLLQQ